MRLQPRLAILLLAAVLTARAAPLPGNGRDRRPPPVVWHTDYEQALALAKVELKPVFVLFSSPGCSWCHRLKAGPLQDPAVTALLRNFVPVLVDVTEDRETAAFFVVSAVPRVAVLDSRGIVLR